MATYMELRQLFSDGELRNRIEVACIVAAETIRGEDPSTFNHANRLLWAKEARSNLATFRDPMLKVLLAINKDAAVEAITGVTDAALQAMVDAAVDLFADGS